jgi:hypothetical protein
VFVDIFTAQAESHKEVNGTLLSYSGGFWVQASVRRPDIVIFIIIPVKFPHITSKQDITFPFIHTFINGSTAICWALVSSVS